MTPPSDPSESSDRSKKSEKSDKSDRSLPRHPICRQDGKAIGSNSCPCPLPCADRDAVEKLKS